jgi:hypothetical protein
VPSVGPRTRQDLRAVGLLARRREPALAGPAPVELELDLRHDERSLRRAAVVTSAPVVRLAPGVDPEDRDVELTGGWGLGGSRYRSEEERRRQAEQHLARPRTVRTTGRSERNGCPVVPLDPQPCRIEVVPPPRARSPHAWPPRRSTPRAGSGSYPLGELARTLPSSRASLIAE